MRFEVMLGVAAIGLFIGMLICMNIGYHFGRKQSLKIKDVGKIGFGTLDAATFGLMGLILAFAFNGAATRFDVRRHLAIEEANAIGTAFLRIDLLRPEDQPAMRERFKIYLDSRLKAYNYMPDIEAAIAELARSNSMQREIWHKADQASQATNYLPAAMQLLPAINNMIDIATTRTVATRVHPPLIIFALLFMLPLLSSLLAGYGMADCKNRRWLYMFIFSLAIALTVYVICDLEYPRIGLILVDDADQVLKDLRQTMDGVTTR